MTTTDLPVHPDTGLTAIGLIDGIPVWPVYGAADDDDDDTGIDLEGGSGGKGGDQDDDDADEGDTDDDADEGQDDDTDDWKPPSKEEWNKVQDALKKANSEAKRHREAAQKARREKRTAQRTANQSGDKDDADAAAAAEEAERVALAKLKPVAVRSAAAAALLKAHFQNPTEARIDRMIRRLDMDDLDVDLETGRIDGLDDQIDELVDEFPELFTEPKQADDDGKDRGGRPPRRAGRINGAQRKNDAPPPKTTGEKHAARILGGH